MTAVVVTHAVGNIDTWLKGGADREELFAKFCSSHRIFTLLTSATDFAPIKQMQLEGDDGNRGNKCRKGEAHRDRPH